MTAAPVWRVTMGWIVAVFLPIAAVLAAHRDTLQLAAAPRYFVLFLLAMVAAKVGKWMTGSYWDQTLRSVMDDGVLSIVLAGVAYEVAVWVGRHGGGPVHPSLAAVAGAYLVMLWPLRI